MYRMSWLRRIVLWSLAMAVFDQHSILHKFLLKESSTVNRHCVLRRWSKSLTLSPLGLFLLLLLLLLLRLLPVSAQETSVEFYPTDAHTTRCPIGLYLTALIGMR